MLARQINGEETKQAKSSPKICRFWLLRKKEGRGGEGFHSSSGGGPKTSERWFGRGVEARKVIIRDLKLLITGKGRALGAAA